MYTYIKAVCTHTHSNLTKFLHWINYQFQLWGTYLLEHYKDYGCLLGIIEICPIPFPVTVFFSHRNQSVCLSVTDTWTYMQMQFEYEQKRLICVWCRSAALHKERRLWLIRIVCKYQLGPFCHYFFLSIWWLQLCLGCCSDWRDNAGSLTSFFLSLYYYICRSNVVVTASYKEPVLWLCLK